MKKNNHAGVYRVAPSKARVCLTHNIQLRTFILGDNLGVNHDKSVEGVKLFFFYGGGEVKVYIKQNVFT